MLKILMLCLCLGLLNPLISVLAQEPALEHDCWFTASEDIPAYGDSELLVRHPAFQTMEAGLSFRVAELGETKALLTIDHAFGFWIEISNGILSGDCTTVTQYETQFATVTANTRLWSYLDVETGEVIQPLSQDTEIIVMSGAVSGRIRFDSSVRGNWYQIRVGDLTGWVWAERLNLQQDQSIVEGATALNNTRLWTLPTVVDSLVVMELAKGTIVNIIGGPVSGRIRVDEPITGVWYQVQVDNQIGWVWEGRLEFE